MRPCTPALAFRYDPAAGFQLLTAVKPREVTYREGARPSVAAFTYVTNNMFVDSYPIWIEHVLPLATIANPHLVYPDERIVIATMGPEGLRFLFDGYAQIPEVSWTGRRQDIVFQAQGVEIRAWDDTITGMMMRDASDYTNNSRNRLVESKIVFNPVVERESRGNMLVTGLGYEAVVAESGREYAPFVDPLVDKEITYTDPKENRSWRDFWDIAEAVNTLIAVGNRHRDLIATPNRDYLNNEMVAINPTPGPYYDPDDSTTYERRSIILPETEITDLPWPEAVEKICKPNGFAMCFRLATHEGLPKTFLDIYRLEKSDRSNYKDVYLQPAGSTLDPGATNLAAGRLATDVSGIINQVIVRTAPVRYEVGLILAPLFKIDTVNDLTNKDKYDSSKDEEISGKPYRLFGMDECGEGHSEAVINGPTTNGEYFFGNWTWKETAPDLSPIFGIDLDGNPDYAEHRRATLPDLWSKDADGDYRKYRLYVSTDYTGKFPAVWDGKSGTWFRVNKGFKNLDDRIGIRVTHQKPNEWNIGKPTKGVTYTSKLNAQMIKTIDWLSNPNQTARTAFALLLVCTMEGDHPLPVMAGRRDVSSTTFEITRTIDLADKLRPGIIHPSSYFHPDKGKADAKPLDAGNTEDDAYGYALNKRDANQYGKVAGDFVIRRITYAYQIGDRIRRIAGRNASLRTNRGGEFEAAVYPRVIGLSFKLDNVNETQLVLTDERADMTD